MSTATLTSLAMLKVTVDRGQDYLDYLRPFILQVLVDHELDPVTDRVVQDHIRRQFGLDIPERAIQVVLKRLSKKVSLKKEMGVYRITGTLPDPGIAAEKSKAERHIQAVVSGLKEFSKTTINPIPTSDEAVTAIIVFLTKFDIQYIRYYLRGTTIPTLEGDHESHIVLVSEYVLGLQKTNPERFDSFMVMVQGHMLANALLCPDLQFAPKTYKGMTFYLDTPLLVRRLGLEGEHKKAAIENLIRLLHNLGATVATFSHSYEELEHVIIGAADYVDARAGRSAIVMEARRTGTTRSDLLLLAEKIDDKLREAKIEVKATARYTEAFQIDEAAFEEALKDEVSYFNPRAIEYDISSVRSIYVLREHTSPTSVEKSRAVLVTSNSGFARAAFEYGLEHQETRVVSSVITDFSLANIAWLKAPMGAPSLPTTEVLAFCYAALQPSKELLSKYLTEIDKLEKQGKITERDHQLLRSSTLAHVELVHLTLGDENALTEETVTETLRRVTNEIKKEEDKKLTTEQAAHLQTQQVLASERATKKQLQERVFWQCRRRAEGCAWVTSGFVVALLVVGLAGGLGLWSSNLIPSLVITVGIGGVILMTLVNFIFGTTVKRLHQQVQDRCLIWFIKREAAATGIDLADVQ